MKNNKDFTVFILTHGRPNKIKTLATLQKQGYTGQIYYVVDNEDKTAGEYIKKFGRDKVKIFHKKAFADAVDEGNNFDERRGILHARNACFSIAKELGITYFMELDDDYTSFYYRLYVNDKIEVKPVKNMDVILEKYLDFYKSTKLHSIAFAQGGDFIGGFNLTQGELYKVSKRKCMNSFLCSTERPFQFVGVFNEDVNTYTSVGARGGLFLTVPFVSLTQTATQSQKSGITDLYLKFGTYCKSFTSVMMQPSSVKVTMMQTTYSRIHHMIKWINTTPMIVPERYKKQ